MDGSWKTFATMAGGGVLGLALAFAVTLGTAPADGRDAAPVVSNRAAKQDRLEIDRAAVRHKLPRSATVAQVEIQQGPAGAVVTLFDSNGQIVYRSDPERRETTVSRGAVIPTSMLRAASDSPARIVSMQDAIRAAKADPEGFLAATLRDEAR